MKINAMLLSDCYKFSHKVMSEKGTTSIYSTMTPRGSRIEGIDHVVFHGLQGFIKERFIEYFNDEFFNRPLEDVLKSYKRIIKSTLGEACSDTSHIESLHNLGFLPIRVKALPEGTRVPIRVPMFTVENTLPQFYWLTNFLETMISADVWKVITTTTIVREYFNIANMFADKTCCNRDHVQWQMHNFSFRGLGTTEEAIRIGAGHLLYFTGTDTLPSIPYLEDYYGADCEKELIGASILATEHSIQCQYKDDYTYIKRMITEVAPSGMVATVCDGRDYWNVIGEVIPSLKEEIMARDGKHILRPDSGDPVKIICGTLTGIKDYTDDCKDMNELKAYVKEDLFEEEINDIELERGESGPDEVYTNVKWQGKYYHIRISNIGWNRYDKQYYYYDSSITDLIYSVEGFTPSLPEIGSIQALWNIFGGTTNEKGYKVLDSHIGLIYGDAITPERAIEILTKLKKAGFASSNIVFGIGSYSLGYYTRDTFGMAIKATHTVVNGEERLIFKDPKTDDGLKKSQRGRVVVFNSAKSGKIVYADGLTIEDEEAFIPNLLEEVFVDGVLVKEQTLSEIRERVRK